MTKRKGGDTSKQSETSSFVIVVVSYGLFQEAVGILNAGIERFRSRSFVFCVSVNYFRKNRGLQNLYCIVARFIIPEKQNFSASVNNFRSSDFSRVLNLPISNLRHYVTYVNVFLEIKSNKIGILLFLSTMYCSFSLETIHITISRLYY